MKKSVFDASFLEIADFAAQAGREAVKRCRDIQSEQCFVLRTPKWAERGHRLCG